MEITALLYESKVVLVSKSKEITFRLTNSLLPTLNDEAANREVIDIIKQGFKRLNKGRVYRLAPRLTLIPEWCSEASEIPNNTLVKLRIIGERAGGRKIEILHPSLFN